MTPTESSTEGADSIRPDILNSIEEFAAALTQLRERLGLSIRQVARATDIPNATLGGYFSGRHLPPPTQPQVLDALLEALNVPVEDRARWREATIRLRRLPGPRSTESPYRGLESYRVDDAHLYVGREEQLEALRSMVNSEELEPRCIAVVGPSGCGKSSLLHAGLIAESRARGIEALSLDPLGADAQLAALAERPPGGTTLIVLDQFEQVLVEDISAETRARLLAHATTLSRRTDTTVVLGLRADFYSRALLQPALLPLLHNQVPIGAMTHEQLARVISEPAARLKQPVESAFVDLVLRELTPRDGLAESTRLPLVSHALLMTWEHGNKLGLTAASYAAIGGVAGAVQASAEAAYASLGDDGREAVRRLFDLMLAVDADGLATGRPALFGDIKAEPDLVDAAEVFVAHRILTATSTGYVISHESLTRAWPRLAEWLAADQDRLRTRRRLALSAANWEEHGRSDDGLIRGGFLADAASLEASGAVLTSVESDLVRASEASEARERDRARRSRRRLGVIAVSALTLAVVATALSVVLFRVSNDLEAERNNALSRQVAAEAALLRPTDPALSAQLAVAAYRLAPTPEARSALLEATGERLVTRLLGVPGPMRAVPSPDGRMLAVVDANGDLRLYRLHPSAAPTLLSSTATKGGQLYAAAWAPDSEGIAVGGSGGRVLVYRVTPGGRTTPTTSLSGGNGVENLHYDPAGTTLYAATGAGLLRWRRAGDVFTALPALNGFGGTVNDVAISSRGLVATASSDGLLRLWVARGSALTLKQAIPLGGPNVYAYTVAFSHDGTTLVEGEKDKIARVYAVSGTTARPLTTLTGFSSWVTSVAFSPDGAHLTAGASGGIVQEWKAMGWTRELSFRTPSNVTSVSYTPDGRTITLGTIDGTAFLSPSANNRPPAYGDTIWNLDTSPDGRQIYLGAGSAVATVPSLTLADRWHPVPDAVAFTAPPGAGKPDGSVSSSRDGRWVASGTSTGDILVWPAAGPRSHPFVLPAATQLIENTRFSHDSRLLAATADDGTTTLVDVSGARPRRLAQLHIKTLALAVGFSPDNSLIAVGGADNLIHVFALRSGRPVATLRGFTNYVYGVAFSPDSRYLAGSSTDKTVRVWDLSNPRDPRLLPEVGTGPTDTVYSVAWNRAGDQLMGASQDGTVWQWQFDGQGARPYAHMGNLGGGVTEAIYLPGGAIMAVGFQGLVDTWAADVTIAAKEICAATGSPITKQEWNLYVPGAAYERPCS